MIYNEGGSMAIDFKSENRPLLLDQCEVSSEDMRQDELRYFMIYYNYITADTLRLVYGNIRTYTLGMFNYNNIITSIAEKISNEDPTGDRDTIVIVGYNELNEGDFNQLNRNNNLNADRNFYKFKNGQDVFIFIYGRVLSYFIHNRACLKKLDHKGDIVNCPLYYLSRKLDPTNEIVYIEEYKVFSSYEEAIVNSKGN